MPQTPMRQMIWKFPASVGRAASQARPAAKMARPTPPRMAADTRSASHPARGAAMATPSGQGVSSSPVCTWSRCMISSNWKGRAMNAAIWAVKEITEVTIDRAKMRMRSRSSGTSGRGSGSSRRTSTTPATTPRASSRAPARRARVRVRTSTPVTTRPKAKAFSPALSRSKRSLTSGFFGRVRAATRKVATPRGTLMANSHCQVATARIAAARVGPAAAAVATTRAFSPTPRPSILCG